MNKTYQTHEFLPVYDQESRVLILGSFPSVKSRETGFYYGHPKNRFWKLLAFLYDTKEPVSIEGKKEFLKERKIALWDVIESCEIAGSSDSSIERVAINDVGRILRETKIQAVYANGRKAESLYRKYLEPVTGIKAAGLPSTSPANASFSLNRLKEQWKRILEDAKSL